MIAELLHRILVFEASENERQAFRYRPSNAGPQRCIRQLTYSRIGQKVGKELSGRMLAIFERGTWNEAIAFALIERSAYKLHSQQMKVVCWQDGSLILQGSVDAIVTDPVDYDRLLELKGINHFTWNRYAAGEQYPEDYLTQCALYLRGLWSVQPLLRECLLLLLNKNTEQLLEYLLDYDYVADRLTIKSATTHLGETTLLNLYRDRIVQSAVEKFKEVENHAVAETLPERPIGFKPGEWPCGYCPFEEECWKGYAVETVQGGEIDLSGEPNMELFCGQYLGLSARAKEADAEKDAVRDRLVTIMREWQATKATCGGFTVTRSVQTRPGRLDETKLSAGMKIVLEGTRGPVQVVETIRVRKKEIQ